MLLFRPFGPLDKLLFISKLNTFSMCCYGCFCMVATVGTGPCKISLYDILVYRYGSGPSIIYWIYWFFLLICHVIKIKSFRKWQLVTFWSLILIVNDLFKSLNLSMSNSNSNACNQLDYSCLWVEKCTHLLFTVVIVQVSGAFCVVGPCPVYGGHLLPVTWCITVAICMS